MTEGRFKPGDRISLKVDPTSIGRIDGQGIEYPGGVTYPFFFGGNDVRFVAEMGLEAAPKPEWWESIPVWDPRNDK